MARVGVFDSLSFQLYNAVGGSINMRCPLNLKDSSLSDEQLLDAIVAHPKLLQRPIVVRGDRAIIGRPPENVLDLLK